MFLSVSRRTDIPAFYSNWFYNRISEQKVLVRNPMDLHQISEIRLSPDAVDGIVFWTKNPLPLMDRLNRLKEYAYYFQFTVTPYGRDIEPNVPSKNDIIIPAFRRLSEMLGKHRVIWRYDPILLNPKYTMGYHIEIFKKMAQKLGPYTEKCIISFLDFYRNTQNNAQYLKLERLGDAEKRMLAEELSKTAQKFGLKMETCAEKIDLAQLGIGHAKCIDAQLFETIIRSPLAADKDRNQRLECGCAASADIGMYNTCAHGCLYCYANYSPKTAEKNIKAHNPASPLLSGDAGLKDKINIRPMKSWREVQMRFY